MANQLILLLIVFGGIYLLYDEFSPDGTKLVRRIVERLFYT